MAAVVLVSLAAALAPTGSAAAARHTDVIGYSVQHRPLRVAVVGDPSAPRKVLVVGCIHGSERAGLAVTRALRKATPPAGTQFLVVDTVNPDGCRSGTRGNAHGVDLNRNFPWGWRRLGGVFDSGPSPSSEPETRAVEAFVLRERPDVSIWFHQHLNWVDLQRGSDEALMRRYATVAGMRAVRTAVLPGTVARWENHRLSAGSAFFVELPAGRLPAARLSAHVRALLAIAPTDSAVGASGARAPTWRGLGVAGSLPPVLYELPSPVAPWEEGAWRLIDPYGR
ncbi:MAG: murein peptide amidase [Solirubrobacterales bacterium]|nr:murein peptide amidase [Solirubrobacterales bacterium]